jgi:hypothetical protein
MFESDQVDDWSWEVVSTEYKKLENSRLEGKSKILENRIVREYLVNKCESCQESPCFNFHQGQKPRRQLISLGEGKWNYSSKKCQKSRCNQEKCPFAHSTEEIYFHPDRYKKDPCKYSAKNGECEIYGFFCPYQHCEIDIFEVKPEKFELETFKTIKCEIKKQHMYSTCMFFHDHLKYSDRRRSLKEFSYSSESCPEYGNCKDGDCCKYCHSEVEFKYHPSRFKTKPCVYKENCQNKEICPFFHIGSDDKMIVQARNIKLLITKCQEKLEACRKLQSFTLLLDKFLCSACREVKCEVIMKCGHSRCQACKTITYCNSCETETSVLVSIKVEN